MVKFIAPALLVLLASCGTVSGRSPRPEEFDPKGFVAPPEGTTALNPAESQRILEEWKGRLAAGFPIYPDDELRITVLGWPDLTLEARVPQEGSIHYGMIGLVQLSGRSLEQIREDIKSRLEKDYLVSAQVSVQIRSHAPKHASVLGAVGRSGGVELPSGRFATLLGAVASAGGFTEDADLHSVVIYRAKSLESVERQGLTVDVLAIRNGKGHDPVLLPNDVVYVPGRDPVYVYGQVAHPGRFPLGAEKRLTATQAIALAGGYTRVANESNVRLKRRGKDGKDQFFVLNLTKVRDNAEGDVPLQPGDTLYVPESTF